MDEILSSNPNAAGLGINWQIFGSNGQEKADYSRGVLERFTQRTLKDWAPDGAGNAHIKTISNPRAINFDNNPHFANYFEGMYSVNENGGIINGPFNNPVTGEKIVVNHYHCKSCEEYRTKKVRGIADKVVGTNYSDAQFKAHDRNEIFDDGILKYRAERAKNFRLPDKSHADERLFDALAKNLSPTLLPNTPPEFYAGKMETFLTCRAVAAYLQTKLINNAPAKLFEETALVAIFRTLASGGFNFADARLLLSELPELLTLNYPVIDDIRNACIQLIPQLEEPFHVVNRWPEIVELDYIKRLLQSWRPQ